MKHFNIRFLSGCAILAAAIFNLAAADNPDSPKDKERQLIHVLESDAPPQDKAVPCKQLAIYGTKEAVPALARLLSDQNLASWARIALEAIPDPAADEALRQATTKLQGRLLIGVINSIGTRRDAQAFDALAEKLRDTDPEVASAAAEALGRIGGTQAANALAQALPNARVEVRSAVAYGCILCAEKMLAESKPAEAAKLYDTVRQAQVPKQRLLEATRGAILARGADGIPLLVEQLRSKDKAFFGIALRTARELRSPAATDALVAELDRSSPERQVPLLLALADRPDAAVLPKLVQVAQNGPRNLRASAIAMLDRFNDLSCVPVLLNAAADADLALARPAKAALARLGGKEVDADLLARLPQANAKQRQVVLELARQRRIDAALPLAWQSSTDSDAGVRRAAVEAIGTLGTDQEAPRLVKLISQTKSSDDREDVERALVAICGRGGARCLPPVLPLAQAGDSALRKISLRALASIGGPEALAAVKNGIKDRDETVQDEAVTLLANWPNNWPEDTAVAEPLLTLAKSARKTSHQVQGLRGYLQYLQEEKQLKPDEKLGKVTGLLPLIQRAEEKQLAIAVIGTVPTAAALEPLIRFASDRAVREEACVAIMRVAAADNRAESKDQRRKALQTVIDQSKNDSTRKKASAALKRIN